MGDEIGPGHGVKTALAKHGAQAREIFAERREHAKPILAIVDLQPFEGSEAVIRLDETRGIALHRTTAGSTALHAFGGGKRLHHGASHGALKLHQLHTASASGAVARKNLLAFRASS